MKLKISLSNFLFLPFLLFFGSSDSEELDIELDELDEEELLEGYRFFFFGFFLFGEKSSSKKKKSVNSNVE